MVYSMKSELDEDRIARIHVEDGNGSISAHIDQDKINFYMTNNEKIQILIKVTIDTIGSTHPLYLKYAGKIVCAKLIGIEPILVSGFSVDEVIRNGLSKFCFEYKDRLMFYTGDAFNDGIEFCDKWFKRLRVKEE